MEEFATRVVLEPGKISLASWRAIYRGASVALDPACYPAIDKAAAVVDTIAAQSERATEHSANLEAIAHLTRGHGPLAKYEVRPIASVDLAEAAD